MNLLLILLLNLGFSQAPPLQEEKELSTLNFENIKDVLKKDGLSQEVKKKKETVRKIQILRQKELRELYKWPTEDEFWVFATEYWLVKESSVLKWDIDKPDYGLDETLSIVLKKIGYMKKKFRIIAIDAQKPAHLGMAWRSDEFCLMFSIPFVRSMDLSKLEISLLLLQDILRVEEGWLKEVITPTKLKTLAGTVFQGKKPDLSPVYDVSKSYREFIDKKGFSFQQQFQLTKKMDSLLRPHTDLWNAYVRLLGKMDRLVKSQQSFSDYSKLYPSPEMQIRWLAPEEKVL
jgi:hypothetical protein